MKYILELPDDFHQKDDEDKPGTILKGFYETGSPAIELYDPVNWITGKTQSVPHKIYAVPEAVNEKSEG